jgi:hypothetical protein
MLKKWWVRVLLVAAILAAAYWLGLFSPGFEHGWWGTPGARR